MRKNGLFLEIADISNEDGYIEFPVYNSQYYLAEDGDEKIPLSTYYYEALQLCIVDMSERTYLEINQIIEVIEKAWIVCNEDNISKINEIVREISNNVRKAVRSSEHNNFRMNNVNLSNIEYSYSEIDKYYKDWTRSNKKIANDLKKEKANCVALAMPIFKSLMDENNCYLSVSGAAKDYSGNSGAGIISKNIKKIYLAVNNLIKYIFGFRFIECHLIDDTRRYTHFDKRINFDRGTTNGIPLLKPIKFINDLNIRGKSKNFYAHYSCCEKKILAYMDFINLDSRKLLLGYKVVNKLTSYEFRIKKEPCRMCRPALIGCYCISYGYYDYLQLVLHKRKKHQIKCNKIISKKEPFIVW